MPVCDYLYEPIAAGIFNQLLLADNSGRAGLSALLRVERRGFLPRQMYGAMDTAAKNSAI